MKRKRKTTIKRESENINNIKIGHFQLQTKSFWLALVSILSGFILIAFFMNYRFSENVMKHNEEIIKILKIYDSFNKD